MDDLWGDIAIDQTDTKEAFDLIKQQANLLSKKTNNLVKASFEKIKYEVNKSTLMTSFSSMFSTAAKIYGMENKKVEVKDDDDLKDAGSFYKEEEYKFEIKTSEYKYRLFIVDFKPIYPIEVEVEYGILDKQNFKINSIIEMKNILKNVFQSKKVRTILAKMIGIEQKNSK